MRADLWHIRLNGPHCQHVLDLPSSGISAIFGESGSGKTSLLRALAGLDRMPGDVYFNNQCWQSAAQFLPPKMRKLAMAFQEPRLLPHKTVRDNIFLGRTPHFSAATETLFSELNITPLLSQRAEQLSGGEQHRVALARALLQPSQVILLDEPLTGLDQQRRRMAIKLIKARATNTPILLVTHQLDELLALADHLVLMDKSQSLNGSLDALVNHPILIQQRGHECSVLTGRCIERDAHSSLLDLGAGNHLRLISQLTSNSASEQRVAIDARDVSLCLSKATDSSIMNILPATITQLKPTADGTCAVTLSVGEQILRALVSDYSAKNLALAVGKKVYAQIKGTIALTDNAASNS